MKIYLKKFVSGQVTLIFVLACFALSPTAQAVTPAPDGGYPNGNTAEGTNALFSLTTGEFNTAIGFRALHNNDAGFDNTATGVEALFSNTGQNNTANGFQALYHNTNAVENTAIGASALFRNTSGDFNTATGYVALYGNTKGNGNTATGCFALESNTTASHNTANGYATLQLNTGHDNTATGWGALFGNSNGNNNTANGSEALLGQLDNDGLPVSTGSNNTANGYRALYSYTTGGDNVANGVNALLNNTTGNHNTANGRGALNKNTTANDNTADGYQALNNNNTGSGNIALGYQAGLNLTTGNSNIDIGNVGVAGEASTIRIGSGETNTYIAGISGVTVAGGVGVIVDSSGHLGTIVSSAHFKDEIKPMDKASEAILALKPVTFHYKKELDPDGIPQFGLVAEEVEKVNPDLVARDAEGKVYTVRYEAVNAMLLNEFLKEHREVQEQKATITQLKSSASKQEVTIAKQQKQIEALATGLQKVSDRLELNKPAPQIVDNQ